MVGYVFKIASIYKSVSIGKVQQGKCDAKLNVVKGNFLPRFRH